MPEVVVTGAGGLVGSALVPRLAESGRVFAVTRRARSTRGEAVRWIEHDLSRAGLPPGLPEWADAVVYLAQSRRFREFPDGAADVVSVNVTSALGLLEWARTVGARTFVYASTGGVYRGGEDRGYTEDDPVCSDTENGLYLASKRSVELIASAYGEALTVVLLRFFFIYGPGQDAAMLVPRLIAAIGRGEAVFLDGSDGIKINPVHVEDAVDAVRSALALDRSATINVAGPEVLTLRQVAEEIGRVVGRQPVLTVKPVEPRHLVGDITRMTALLGRPTHRFHDRVAELAQ